MAGPPDLVPTGLDELWRLERAYAAQVTAGRAPAAVRLRQPAAAGEPIDFIRRSAAALRRELGALTHAA